MWKMLITCRDCNSYITFRDGYIPTEFFCLNCGKRFIEEEVKMLIRKAKENGNK